MTEIYALLVGGGPSQLKLVPPLRKRGFKLIVIAQDPPSFEAELHLPVSTYDWPAVYSSVESLRKERMIGLVASRTSGPASYTVAALAHCLGLPGSGLTLGEAASSKLGFCKVATAMGLDVIPTVEVEMSPQGHTNMLFPIVVKPNVGLVGKRSITLVRDNQTLHHAIKCALTNSWDQKAVAQPFVDGRDFNIVLLAEDGRVVWRTVFEERSQFSASGEIIEARRFLVGGAESKRVWAICADAVARFIGQSRTTGHSVFSFRGDLDAGKLSAYETNIGPPADGVSEDLLPLIGHDAFEEEVSALTQAAPTEV